MFSCFKVLVCAVHKSMHLTIPEEPPTSISATQQKISVCLVVCSPPCAHGGVCIGPGSCSCTPGHRSNPCSCFCACSSYMFIQFSFSPIPAPSPATPTLVLVHTTLVYFFSGPSCLESTCTKYVFRVTLNVIS